MFDLVILSPRGAHILALKVVGEIRYGPNYNTVYIDGVVVKDVQVGDNPEWLSPHLVALQEWIRVPGRAGPDTRLLVIDAERGVICRGPSIERGLVEGFRLWRRTGSTTGSSTMAAFRSTRRWSGVSDCHKDGTGSHTAERNSINGTGWIALPYQLALSVPVVGKQGQCPCPSAPAFPLAESNTA